MDEFPLDRYHLSIDEAFGDRTLVLECLDTIHQGKPGESWCGTFDLPTLQTLVSSARQHHQIRHEEGFVESLVDSRWVNRRTGRVSRILRVKTTTYGLTVVLQVEGGRSPNSRSLESLREYFRPYDD